MSISLGGVTLPDTMYLKRSQEFVAQNGSDKRTILGRLMIWRTPIVKGEPIDLIGKLEYQTIVLIQALQTNASNTLVYHSSSFTTAFRVTDYPHISFDPLNDISQDTQNTDLYYGTIRLITL